MNGLRITEYEIEKVTEFFGRKDIKILGGHEYRDQDNHLCAEINVQFPEDYHTEAVEIDYRTGSVWQNNRR